MALLGGGGHAELVTVDARHVLSIPEDIDWPGAGGFMEAFATAHDALVVIEAYRRDPDRAGTMLGVIDVESDKLDAFGEDDRDFLEHVAALMAGKLCTAKKRRNVPAH